MNFVGHIHLAALKLAATRSETTPGLPDADDRGLGFLIGSALPDVAAIGRFRLAERPTNEAISAGVDLHHRTDDAFHRHPWFRRHSNAVSEELERVGLARGAAMACGHVGVELLLDGQLLDEELDLRRLAERAMAQVSDPRLELATVVKADHQSDWASHLESIARWPLPTNYRHPDAVAERLRRIVAKRPRLAFSPGQVAAVADALAAHQSKLESTSGELIEDLRTRLTA